ncbi:metal-dependent hydrolase [Actinocrispum wychmicini]|uniref:LexA-binding, inner membrane-associated putative hydrolase n=1 Tax=Actinocrispum wychmicini TaxID=1213861 RepID=A0A4V2S8X1_9PSEU|nr:metal-dependent hydrolase [Actinocrispum wychmicini]TCO65510.1 LexA-binding, inner membrane-associated putative hydrolase [Actinocrispum wychmicini]
MATGPTHAMSGLLVWSAVTALATDHAIGQLSPRAWVVGAVLATGGALLPDLDHPSSTISRTFGSISQGFSSLLHGMSHGVYRLTRTRRDANRHGGHRGLTHTVFFAVVAAIITTSVVLASQKWALPVLMFVFCGLAIRGVLHKWDGRNDALVITVASIALTALCLMWTDRTSANAAACGVAVGIGCVAHYLGDAITEQGCPMLWPIPLGGKTWYPVAPPKIMRMRTGGTVELVIVAPIITLLSIWLGLAALQHTGALPFLGGVKLLPWT